MCETSFSQPEEPKNAYETVAPGNLFVFPPPFATDETVSETLQWPACYQRKLFEFEALLTPPHISPNIAILYTCHFSGLCVHSPSWQTSNIICSLSQNWGLSLSQVATVKPAYLTINFIRTSLLTLCFLSDKITQPNGGYSEEASDCRWRRLWKDLSVDCVQQGPVPRGVRPHCVRELRGWYRGWWQTGGINKTVKWRWACLSIYIESSF